MAMNLVDRVKRILLSPQTEWQVIDAEPTTPQALYTGYIGPLAAVGPVAQLIGYSVFGITIPFAGTYRVPLGSGLTTAVVGYILSLVATYVLALIIDALAPTFEGQRSQIQALKLAAYSSTAAWLAGIFALIPGLRVLTILGLYSLYLLYLGVPVLMKSPKDRAIPYTAVIVLAAVVLFSIVGFITGRLMRMPYPGA
jgi:Yip1-like protein